MLKDGLIDQIDPIYWAYVGGFVVFAMLGMCLQYRNRPKQEVKHPYMKR